jgi:hypothetical protein
MSNKFLDAVVFANREKTTKICESLVQILDRGIRVLWLDCGISKGIERLEAEANTTIQAVTVKP